MTFNGDTDPGHRDHRGDRHRAWRSSCGPRSPRPACPAACSCSGRRITIQMRQQIEGAIGMKVAPFVLPLAVAIFVLHPGLQLAGGAARAVRRLRRCRGRAVSSRRPRTSTSCWRSRCSSSSATTRRASGAAASSVTRSRWSRVTSRFLAPINIVEETRQADLAGTATFRQHLRRRHPGGAHRDVPLVHPVGAQRDLEDVRPVRRPDPGVHLLAADDPVLQPVDGARPRSRRRAQHEHH